MATDSEIIRALETLYNAPLSEITTLHPEEIEWDLTNFDDEQLRFGLSTLPFTADEANAAISRVGGD